MKRQILGLLIVLGLIAGGLLATIVTVGASCSSVHHQGAYVFGDSDSGDNIIIYDDLYAYAYYDPTQGCEYSYQMELRTLHTSNLTAEYGTTLFASFRYWVCGNQQNNIPYNRQANYTWAVWSGASPYTPYGGCGPQADTDLSYGYDPNWSPQYVNGYTSI